MKSLFGDEIPDVEPAVPIGSYQKTKFNNHYRRSKEDKICCKYCRYVGYFRYHDKGYYKCSIIGISHSTATDIRARNVCDRFEVRQP